MCSSLPVHLPALPPPSAHSPQAARKHGAELEVISCLSSALHPPLMLVVLRGRDKPSWWPAALYCPSSPPPFPLLSLSRLVSLAHAPTLLPQGLYTGWLFLLGCFSFTCWIFLLILTQCFLLRTSPRGPPALSDFLPHFIFLLSLSCLLLSVYFAHYLFSPQGCLFHEVREFCLAGS